MNTKRFIPFVFGVALLALPKAAQAGVIVSNPAISAIYSSSVTVTWTSTSTATGFEALASTSPGFVPVYAQTSSTNPAATALTVTGLSPVTQYYFKVGGVSGGTTSYIFTSPISAVTSNASGTNGSGRGAITLVPGSVSEGGVVTATVTFTVPSIGMNMGGRLEIGAPSNWWPVVLQNTNPGQDGYVTVTSTAPGASFAMTFASTMPVVTVYANAALPSTSTIVVTFFNIHPSCPAPNQTNATWLVKSAMSSFDALADIANQKTQSFVIGSAQWVGYNPWNPLTVVANQASPAILLQANDNCGQPANVGSNLVINLQGILSDGNADTAAVFSSSSSMTPVVSSVTIPSGAASAVYFYKRTSGGNNFQIRGDYQSPVGNFNQQVWRQVNVLATAPAFTNVTVDNGTPVTNQKTIGISPDGTGVSNFAYIRFTPPDNTIQWHVTISSNGFQSVVYERWGSGDPQGTLNWDGRNYANNGTTANGGMQVVANGTFIVKVEVVGILSDTSLSISVASAKITGQVRLGGTPVQGAFVYAQGSNTPGYSSAITDASGNYVLNGLRASFQYNLYANYTNPTNQAVVTGQLNNITANTTGQDFALSVPAVLRVATVLTSSPSYTIYGSINVHTTDYAQNYFGNVRLLAGATTSDNGDPFNPSSWTVLYVKPGTYVLHPSIPGFGTSDFNVTASSDVIISLTPKANIYGVITLPAGSPNVTWVPVEGVKQGNSYPTVWGGVNFNANQTTGIYSLFSVDPGVYTFRARPPGFVPASLNNVTVAGVDIGSPATGGLDFSSGTFTTGGQISGTITVNGNTTSQPNPFPLWISAYSPSLGLNVFTQVTLTPDANTTNTSYQISGVANGTYQIFPPYLQGFEVSPPGPQTITVAGSSATFNLTLSQVTGQVQGSILLPNGQTDYTNVHLSLQGPFSKEVDLSAATYTLDTLGTGNYTLTATYQTTGAQIRQNFLLSNGQTRNMNFDLRASTFSVSGNVSIQNAFSIRNSSAGLVTINTLSDLLASASSQTVVFGGTVFGGGTAATCSGGTPTVLSTVRVEAFPKDFNSFGNANHNNFSNCYGVGQYKYGLIDSSGNYTISGLTSGVWQINVYPYFDNGLTPNAAAIQQTVTIVNGSIQSIDFPLSSGNSVSGNITLPGGITDTRSFNAQILGPRGDLIQSAQVNITAAGGVTYQFTGLPAGSYSLLVQDFGTFDSILNRNVVKYVAKPVQFTLTGTDLTSVDVTLSRAASIVGKLLIQGNNLDGTNALTLITANNQNLLPSNFFISANANPWVPGGSSGANFGPNGAIYIDDNNQFHIDGLVAATYDVMFRQNSYGLSVQGAGSLNLANYTLGSQIITDGQTLDLGAVTLQPGLSLSGTVADANGTPLSNIRIRAQAANDSHGENSIEVFTDATGRFTLSGLDSAARVYNIIAAPRPSSNDNTPFVPYGQVQKLAVDVTVVPAPALNFVLPSATAAFTGKVTTADLGPLSFPDNEQAGFPEAAIYFHLEGSNTDDNPLGQEGATGLDGNFTIPYLVPGIYDITVESLGYRPIRTNGITLAAGVSKDLGTFVLQRGAELDVTLTRPDGSAVNTSQVDNAVAVTPDLNNIIFGKVTTDANTNNIVGIQFSGFEIAPKTYNILFIDKQGNITTPPEGRNITFTSSSDVLTRALTYQQSAPFAFANVTKAGSAVSITYFFSRPLRSRGDDQDPTIWFAGSAHPERLSGHTLSGDRRQLTVFYTPIAGEQNTVLSFSAHTVDIDPSTGVEFVLNKSVTLLFGQKATVENSVNPAIGGNVSLATANDPANISIPSNALRSSTGSAVDAGSSYAFTLTATDDVNTIPAAAGMARNAALGVMMARGSASYVSEAYAAMSAAKAQSTVNPLSSFYSVLLPAGLSHTLNQTAYLTLSYDTNADPATINIYYFDGEKYILEGTQRTIDTVNHTITVGVGHFSTFVVLQNSLPVVIVNGASGSDAGLEAFNFPNPFDLQTKTKTLNRGGTTSTLTTDGTIIRYFVPAAMAGAAHIDIYDVVGEKVRTLDLGTPAGDTFNYVTWDGKNDHGHNVASGVYIGILKAGGNKTSWKMAVIK